MRIILRCPLCREKFKYDIADGWPDECPLCEQRIAHDRADDDVVMPNIFSWKSKNNDKLVRQMMDGSEQRAEMAAAMAGVPVSEMSDLKITNMNDRNDTPIAAMPVRNAVTQHMDAMRARGMPVGFGARADTSGIASGAITVNGQTFQGISPRAGTTANEHLKNRVPSALSGYPLLSKHG